MMTGLAQGAGAWESLADVDYIEKGFTMAQLLERVEKAFGL
jgi:hypothetical protein